MGVCEQSLSKGLDLSAKQSSANMLGAGQSVTDPDQVVQLTASDALWLWRVRAVLGTWGVWEDCPRAPNEDKAES